MPRFLTKSHFKTALECPTKLYYSNKKTEYANQNLDDEFLKALAEGGFQVGELAKYLFCENPAAEMITIDEKEYEKAALQTREKLFSNDHPIIAEGAFLYDTLFARVDILTRTGNDLHIYEVKAKSWKSTKDLWASSTQGGVCLNGKFLPYLQDIAFQKYIATKAYPDLNVKAYLIFADADSTVTIDGLNSLFRIERTEGKTKIKVADHVSRSSLGTIPLKVIPVDRECEWIYTNPVNARLDQDYKFEDTIRILAKAYENDERIWSSLSIKCKNCEFKTSDANTGLKSGFCECWKHWTQLDDEGLKRPLSLELWGGLAGNKSIVNQVLNTGKYFLTEIEESDYWPQDYQQKESGLHPAQRRQLQILKARRHDSSPYLDGDGIRMKFDLHEPPYHFIDFETTTVALPFHAGRKPYEGLAFQYSYHLMDEKGNIEHKSQYVHLEPGFPNYDFVRKLRADLHGKEGTIFRYHNHENTFLCKILDQLQQEDLTVVPDRDQLIDFIENITHQKKKRVGLNNMIDLWEFVLSFYYSPFAKGSNSLKYILPAVIHDSEYIRSKYSQPIYGTEKIPSLNFRNHIWISEKFGMNPYKTLPKVLNGYQNDDLDQFVPSVEEIAEGGAAMMAYAYLQFSDVLPAQKELIKNALYRYCELDTMAMVMIWEFWGNEIGRFS